MSKQHPELVLVSGDLWAGLAGSLHDSWGVAPLPCVNDANSPGPYGICGFPGSSVIELPAP